MTDAGGWSQVLVVSEEKLLPTPIITKLSSLCGSEMVGGDNSGSSGHSAPQWLSDNNLLVKFLIKAEPLIQLT